MFGWIHKWWVSMILYYSKCLDVIAKERHQIHPEGLPKLCVSEVVCANWSSSRFSDFPTWDYSHLNVSWTHSGLYSMAQKQGTWKAAVWLVSSAKCFSICNLANARVCGILFESTPYTREWGRTPVLRWTPSLSLQTRLGVLVFIKVAEVGFAPQASGDPTLATLVADPPAKHSTSHLAHRAESVVSWRVSDLLPADIGGLRFVFFRQEQLKKTYAIYMIY